MLLIVAVLAVASAPVLADELAKIKGRIVGAKCAQTGKVGECYLKWADPMVFWTDEGEYYAIHAGKSSVNQEQIDAAFGQEVEVHGRIAGKQIEIAQVNVLRPPGAKEFFKG
ncbi:MAG: hypothetical protein A2V91_05835 [Candidatus Muproteobacteria bacterium RBG_16_64_10]|uniref:DUF5666 domain-containing protein n=1 Tax=Candidatus Muproteobacteria bacterium RBG_16_64_10 TaxID=1817757 RepID=A0A1F6T1L8_9PROT|nr:MAG: hypothetical protein A2V91_05835 [Candidatus Muproteobacteria bacterium RBG_16_64_10]